MTEHTPHRAGGGEDDLAVGQVAWIHIVKMETTLSHLFVNLLCLGQGLCFVLAIERELAQAARDHDALGRIDINLVKPKSLVFLLVPKHHFRCVERQVEPGKDSTVQFRDQAGDLPFRRHR